MAVTALVITPVPAGEAASSPLIRACGEFAGIPCRLVWDLTHSPHAADFTNVYLAGPIHLVLRVAFVLLVAIMLRMAAGRLIMRLTARAARSQDEADRVAGLADDAEFDVELTEVPPAAATADSAQRAGTAQSAESAQSAEAPGDAAASSPDGASVRRRTRRGTGRRSQRATALASVLSNAASVTIFTVAGVIMLGDLGLNLAPVLASAGVLGIAIGFGAQNLVKDFLAGIFMLLEDQYGVGDYVDIGSVAGTVEAVSLRITRLRDVNGVVWHIRNGTIKLAGNETHGWARAVVDFPVPAQIPVATARGRLERAAVSMWEEPAWHALMLDRPQVWGVEAISADSVLIRIAARTAPQGKAEVTRELRERLKDAIDEAATPAVGQAGGTGSTAAALTEGAPEAGSGSGAAVALTEGPPEAGDGTG